MSSEPTPTPTPTPSPEPHRPGRRLHPLVRVALVAAILTAAIVGWLPFPWRVPVVGALAMALVWLETGSLEAMGLGRPRSARETLGWSVFLLLAVVIVVARVISPILDALSGTSADLSVYGALRGNLELALGLLWKALLSAAIGEELVYRGFFLHHALALVGGSTAGRWLAVVAGGAIFGYAHLEQGWNGVVLTGITGALFCAVFLRSRRNLWALFLGHALMDTWGIASLYFGWAF